MSICQFCSRLMGQGECYLGLKLPKSMRCREFDPSLQKFCSNPDDFANAGQILQMANFFGIKGPELKKIVVLATTAEAGKKQSKEISTLDSTGS